MRLHVFSFDFIQSFEAYVNAHAAVGALEALETPNLLTLTLGKVIRTHFEL